MQYKKTQNKPAGSTSSGLPKPGTASHSGWQHFTGDIMAIQTVSFRSDNTINSYCALHPEEEINVVYNQRLSGMIDEIIQPCSECLSDAEAFGRANQVRDDESKATE
jgi:hypothetical protein